MTALLFFRPRNFAMKAAMNRFSLMGPRPRPPPRHIAMQLIRMQMAAFMRPRHGSIRGQFPFMPMYADPQKMGFDPSLLNAFSQSEDCEEDEGAGKFWSWCLLQLAGRHMIGIWKIQTPPTSPASCQCSKSGPNLLIWIVTRELVHLDFERFV